MGLIIAQLAVFGDAAYWQFSQPRNQIIKFWLLIFDPQLILFDHQQIRNEYQFLITDNQDKNNGGYHFMIYMGNISDYLGINFNYLRQVYDFSSHRNTR